MLNQHNKEQELRARKLVVKINESLSSSPTSQTVSVGKGGARQQIQVLSLRKCERWSSDRAYPLSHSSIPCSRAAARTHSSMPPGSGSRKPVAKPPSTQRGSYRFKIINVNCDYVNEIDVADFAIDPNATNIPAIPFQRG